MWLAAAAEVEQLELRQDFVDVTKITGYQKLTREDMIVRYQRDLVD